MLFSFTFLALVAIFDTGVNAKPPSKIVSGTEVDIREAPFTVMLLENSYLNTYNGVVCGGSIIGKRYILTAAHCLAQSQPYNVMKYHYDWLRVVVGVSAYECGVRTYEILNAYIHPNFNHGFDTGFNDQADIAVLKLRDRINFSATKTRIQLASVLPRPNSIGFIYGWGRSNPNGQSQSRILQKSVQQVYDYLTCKTEYPEFGFYKDELCIKGRPLTSFCAGDSGGPLVVNGKLVGVISNSYGCESNTPGALSNVVYHKEWIEAAIRGSALFKPLPFMVGDNGEQLL